MILPITFWEVTDFGSCTLKFVGHPVTLVLIFTLQKLKEVSFKIGVRPRLTCLKQLRNLRELRIDIDRRNF